MINTQIFTTILFTVIMGMMPMTTKNTKHCFYKNAVLFTILMLNFDVYKILKHGIDEKQKNNAQKTRAQVVRLNLATDLFVYGVCTT